MDGFDLIHRYTRADAIRDGTLIDVSETAREAGIKYPVAMTARVFQNAVRVSAGVTAQGEAGRLWDVLFMLRFAITRHRDVEGDALLYTVFVRTSDAAGPESVKLKAICHPGDAGEPVVTILLPDED